jgi:hypothetical protein
MTGEFTGQEPGFCWLILPNTSPKLTQAAKEAGLIVGATRIIRNDFRNARRGADTTSVGETPSFDQTAKKPCLIRFKTIHARTVRTATE